MVEVSTTWVARRSRGPAIDRATCSDAGPSGKAEDDDVGAARPAAATSPTNVGPVGAPLRAGDVVADDLVTRPDEVRRQDAAHVAETDEADRRHGQPPLCSAARTASSDRRAETPAGAPQ